MVPKILSRSFPFLPPPPLKTSENICVSDVFRGYKNGRGLHNNYVALEIGVVFVCLLLTLDIYITSVVFTFDFTLHKNEVFY